MRYLNLAVCLWALFMAPVLHAQSPQRFVHPPPENPDDQRYTYFWDLLEAILESNKERFGPYELMRFPTPMNAQRAAAEVESGKGAVNIVARATSPELESRLLPVPVPVDKGLIGFRLLLIHKDLQESLSKVNTLQDLQQFSAGQYPAWTDARILRSAGFRVEMDNNYEGLFRLLGARKFALFPRGVNEIYDEWRVHKSSMPDLVIEERLMLHYPLPRYYFVARNGEGERMAARIADGLQRLRKSGEFERRYQAYKKVVLANLKLGGRIVLDVPNPYLSSLAPTDKFWWEDLATELAPSPVGRLPGRKPAPEGGP